MGEGHSYIPIPVLRGHLFRPLNVNFQHRLSLNKVYSTLYCKWGVWIF